MAEPAIDVPGLGFGLVAAGSDLPLVSGFQATDGAGLRLEVYLKIMGQAFERLAPHSRRLWEPKMKPQIGRRNDASLAGRHE